jgi:hypothetical protein
MMELWLLVDQASCGGLPLEVYTYDLRHKTWLFKPLTDDELQNS